MTGTVVVYILVVIVVYFNNAAFRLRKTYPLKKKRKAFPTVGAKAGAPGFLCLFRRFGTATHVVTSPFCYGLRIFTDTTR